MDVTAIVFLLGFGLGFLLAKGFRLVDKISERRQASKATKNTDEE